MVSAEVKRNSQNLELTLLSLKATIYHLLLQLLSMTAMSSTSMAEIVWRIQKKPRRCLERLITGSLDSLYYAHASVPRQEFYQLLFRLWAKGWNTFGGPGLFMVSYVLRGIHIACTSQEGKFTYLVYQLKPIQLVASFEAL